MTSSPVGLGAFPLIVFIAFDMLRPLPAETGGRFGLARAAPDKVFAEETFLVELMVSNAGDDIDRLQFDDGPPFMSEVVRGTPTLEGPLKHDGEVTLRYEAAFKEPGQYGFGTTAVQMRTLFGFAERRFVFYAPFELRVYPKLLTPKLSPIRAKAFAWAGTTQSNYRGGRVEFMNIREFAPGDRLRDINWKAMARLGQRLVNEWQVERGLDCVIVVDLFADDLPRVADWSARGDVIEASFELANSFMTAGNRVGMLVLGRLLLKFRPGFGMKRLRDMVEGMIDSEEGDVWNIESAEQYLERFFRKQYTKRKGTLFFVSAGANMRLVNSVTSLAEKGFVCNVVMVNFVDNEGEALAAKKILTPKETAFGEKFARAELEWVEAKLATRSNVFEWNRENGLVELRGRMA